MDLRRDDFLPQVGDKDGLSIVIRKCPPLEFDKALFLPDLRHALSRFYTLKGEVHPDPVWTVAKELWGAWIYINLPPVTEINIKRKLDKEIQRLDKLKRTVVSKRGASWEKDMKKFILDLENGFDLRSRHQASIDLLVETFEIEIGEDEELLYQDNCVPGPDGKCVRMRACAGDDKEWLKDAIERKLKLENKDVKNQKKLAKIKEEKEALAKMKTVNDSTENLIVNVEDVSKDNNFKAPLRIEPSKVVKQVSHAPTKTRNSNAVNKANIWDE